jgi:hypothetical protein
MIPRAKESLEQTTTHQDWDRVLRDALTGNLRGMSGNAFLRAGARAYTARRAAGKILRSSREEIPAAVCASKNCLSPCPSRAAKVLGDLLKRPQSRLLEEWLRLARQNGVSAPPQHLPALLDLAARKADSRLLILPILDARGDWLAGKRASWQALSPAYRAAWPNQGTQEKLQILRQYRILDQQDAADEIVKSLASESAETRLRLLEVLSETPHQKDAAFFEKALADASLKVAGKAAEMCRRWPVTTLSRRAGNLLKPWLKNPDREPLFPQDLPKRDPVVLSARNFPLAWEEGRKLFAAAIAACPLEVWEGSWKQDYTRMVKWALSVPSRDAWLAGWMISAKDRGGAAKFREAVLTLLNQEDLKPEIRRRLHDIGEQTGFLTWNKAGDLRALEPLIPRMLNSSSSPLHDRHPLLELLMMNADTPVPQRLGRAIVEAIRRHISEAWMSRLPGWSLANYLQQLGFVIEPGAHLAEDTARWPESSPDWPKWASAVERFEKTVHARRVMHEAFTVAKR